MLSDDSRRRLERVGAVVFERGWLSSNGILITGRNGPSALIDSGYCTHAEQSLELLKVGLAGRELDCLLNTHLHSDHCGGNAALQSRYAGLKTFIPPGHSEAVRQWDVDTLTYAPTGQQCPRFHFEDLLWPGDRILLGDWDWEVHGAKGHDPHAVVLFQREHRVLISADALWQNGFGVVFPELEGDSAFREVDDTLNLIEALAPSVVIPGHGGTFDTLGPALDAARHRLQRFVESPARHLRHAHKVLLKFRLLESRTMEFQDLLQWAVRTPYLSRAIASQDLEPRQWLFQLLTDLERSDAIRMDGQTVINV